MLYFDRLITVGVVEDSELSMDSVRFAVLFKLEVDVFDRNLLVVGKIRGGIVLERLQIDFD